MKKVFLSFLLAALIILSGCSAMLIAPEPPAPVESAPVAEEGLGIYSGDRRVSPDCSMRVGDEPLTLTAAFGGVLPAKGAVWESSHPEVLKVTGNDSSCTVEILDSFTGGVTVTVTADGQQEIITIYCLE